MAPSVSQVAPWVSGSSGSRRSRWRCDRHTCCLIPVSVGHGIVVHFADARVTGWLLNQKGYRSCMQDSAQKS